MNCFLLEEQARELANMGPDWTAYHWSIGPGGGVRLYVEVRGGVAPLKTRGPNKGRPNWKKEDKTKSRTVFIPIADYEKWATAWEDCTGKCQQCNGDGRELLRCGVNIDTEYGPCPRCKGTGAINKETK